MTFRSRHFIHVILSIVLVIVAALLLPISCSKKKAEIPQSDWEKMMAIRAEANSYYKDMMEDRYKMAAFDMPSHAESICERYQSLFTKKNVELLQRIEDFLISPPEETKARRLKLYLIQGMLTCAGVQSSDYLSTLRLDKKISDGKDSISYYEIPGRLAEEINRNRRQRLFDAQLPILQKENAILEKIRIVEDSALLDFGYGDMVSFQEEMHACDFALFSEIAAQFIEETDSLTRALLMAKSPKLTGVQWQSFRGYDLPYLTGGHQFDKWFPPSETTLFRALGSSLVKMGIAFDTTHNFTIKIEKKPVPLLRSATYPVSIPFDVRMLISPVTGVANYSVCFHEMGHAQGYLHTNEVAFEFVYLGDKTITETSAFLIEQLLDEPRFVKEYFGITGVELGEYLRYRALMKLISVRSYCGDFLFEQSFYSGSEDPKIAYERIKQPLLNYPWNDVDRETFANRADYFYSVDYLRAWFLSAQIHARMKSEYGDNYFEQVAAGELLLKLWGSGNRIAAEDLADSLGLGELSPTALKTEIESMLQFSPH